MAIKLTSNYSKKVGLPQYSSHQFSVSLETELTDMGQVQGEVTRLYGLLQDAVDRELQHVGFIPGEGASDGNNGMNAATTDNGHHAARKETPWNCSDKQRELILKLVNEHDLDKEVIDQLAIERFGHGVKELNKLEASGLIDELLETHAGNSNGKRRNGNGNGANGSYNRRPSAKGGRS